jgi:hypothetical protein
MDSLQNLLGKYSPREPEEVLIIKHYIKKQFDAVPSSVAFQGDKAIVITVRSAALANTLRFHTSKLQEACNTDKRLLFRIG